MITIENKTAELKSSMKQNWLQNSYQKTYADQFGFVIKYGSQHTLIYQGEPVVTVHSLVAAQLISTIILNDKILNSPIEES